MKLRCFCSTVAALLLVAVMSAGAAANLLSNAGFESPVVTGEAFFAGPGWTSFGGGTFVQDSSLGVPNTGDQYLKTFGVSGVFQDFPASPGQTWNGGSWVLDPSADPMAPGRIAAVNIEWKDAGLGDLGFISNGTFTGGSKALDTWHLQTITGIAPPGTAFARLTLITGDFIAPGAGAPRYDDAFFELIPEPTSAALACIGLMGWLGVRRRSNRRLA